MQQLDEERQLLAINEVVMNEELIIPASNQQPPTSMITILARINSESATQEVQIERPSTHDKSFDSSFGEEFTLNRLKEQSSVSPLITAVSMSSVQSTREYTL